MRSLFIAALIAVPSITHAQTRVSVGVGAGLSGSTDQTLSDGTVAPIVMGQVTHSLFPLLGLGAEVDYWKGSASHIAFATGLLQVRLPVIPLYVKAGLGYGDGNPDGTGDVSGIAGQLGVMYDLTLPLAPVALTLFSNALYAHATFHSAQMVDAGVALTWR